MTADLDDPEGLSGFWQWYDEMTPALRSQVIGPVLARLRSFLLRDFVKTIHGPPTLQLRHGESSRRGSAPGPTTQRRPRRRNVPADGVTDPGQGLADRQRPRQLPRPTDAATPPSTWTRRKTSSPSPPPWTRCSPKPANTGSPWSCPTRTSPSSRGTSSPRCRRTPATSCTSPAHPRTPHLLARHTMPDLDEHDLTHLDAYTAATPPGHQRPANTGVHPHHPTTTPHRGRSNRYDDTSRNGNRHRTPARSSTSPAPRQPHGVIACHDTTVRRPTGGREIGRPRPCNRSDRWKPPSHGSGLIWP